MGATFGWDMVGGEASTPARLGGALLGGAAYGGLVYYFTVARAATRHAGSS